VDNGAKIENFLGHISPPAASPSPEPAPWSSAVGHASTGKSGRVIERLQGEIDRLNRDLHLLKARLDDSEKARETLITRNSYLQDRNSNYEQSQEASSRQLQRKERMIDELRDSLLKEKLRVVAAEETAKTASANEEEWRNEASQSHSLAAQKETEYATIMTCRNLENERHQSALTQLQDSFQTLLRDRTQDHEGYERLQLIAEQQSQTITQLHEVNKKTNIIFSSYKAGIDAEIASLKQHVNSNDVNLHAKLDEMTEVTGRMKWLMAVERDVKYSPSDGRASRHGT
jgi:chromosome segregation ATPase